MFPVHILVTERVLATHFTRLFRGVEAPGLDGGPGPGGRIPKHATDDPPTTEVESRWSPASVVVSPALPAPSFRGERTHSTDTTPGPEREGSTNSFRAPETATLGPTEKGSLRVPLSR